MKQPNWHDVIAIISVIVIIIGFLFLYIYEDSKLEESSLELKFLGIYEGENQTLPGGTWCEQGIYLNVGNGKHIRYIGEEMKIVTGEYVFRDLDFETVILNDRVEK